MPAARRPNRKAQPGCGAGCLGLFAFSVIIGIVVAIISAIASGLTDLAVVIRYGPAGLPPDVTRDSVYPLAWAMFSGIAVQVGVLAGVVALERRSRDRFTRYVDAERAARNMP